VELRGRPVDGPLFLRCDHPACQRLRPRAIGPGEYCRIDLQPAAALRVDLVPLDVPVQALCADLVPLRLGEAAIAAGTGGFTSTCRWRSSSSLHCAGLSPGAYALSIRLGDQVLCEERQVQLSPGLNRWPADGRPLDLRTAAHLFRVLARSAREPSGSLLQVEVVQLAAGVDELREDAQRTDGWFVPCAATHELLVTAHGHVPQRIATPTADVMLRMQPMTRLALEPPPDAEGVRVRIVTDPVHDPALRQFDDDNHHEPDFRCYCDDDNLWFAPGAELEIRRLVDGEPGPAQRVVVGATSPQQVVLR